MKYLGAYLLAVMGGKSDPSEDDLKKILDSAGVEYEESIMKKVLSELEGKDVMEVMAEGRSKLSSVPTGGAVGGASKGAAAADAGAGDAGDAKEEAKDEEEEEEEEEEEMDFDLFD